MVHIGKFLEWSKNSVNLLLVDKKFQQIGEESFKWEIQYKKLKKRIFEIKNPDDKDFALSSLSHLEISINRELAKQTALKISDPFLKSQALFQIFIEELKGDTESAKKTLFLMDDPKWKMDGVCLLMEKEAATNHHLAMKSAEEFKKDSLLYAQCLVTIGKVLVQTNMNAAWEVFEKIPRGYDGYQAKYELLTEIYAIKARTNFDEIFEKVKKTEDPLWKGVMVYRLFEILIERNDLDSAQELLPYIDSKDFAIKAYRQIVKLRAEKDLSETIQEIRLLSDAELQSELLHEIVQMQVRINPNAALKTAFLIPGLKWKNEALAEIAKEMASSDPKFSLEVAKQISNAGKDESILEIIKNILPDNIVWAKEIARELEIPRYKSLAYAEIAKAEIQMRVKLSVPLKCLNANDYFQIAQSKNMTTSIIESIKKRLGDSLKGTIFMTLILKEKIQRPYIIDSVSPKKSEDL